MSIFGGRRFSARLFTPRFTGTNPPDYNPHRITLSVLRDFLAPRLERHPLPMKPVPLREEDDPTEERRLMPDIDWTTSSKWGWCYLDADFADYFGDVIDAGEWMVWGHRTWEKKPPAIVVRAVIGYELEEAKAVAHKYGDADLLKDGELPYERRDAIREDVHNRMLKRTIPTIRTVALAYNVKTGRLAILSASESDLDDIRPKLRPLFEEVFGADGVLFEEVTLEKYLEHSREGAPLPPNLEGAFTDWLMKWCSRNSGAFLVSRDPRTGKVNRMVKLMHGDRVRAKPIDGQGEIVLRGDCLTKLVTINQTEDYSPDDAGNDNRPHVPLDAVSVTQWDVEVADYRAGFNRADYTLRLDASGKVVQVALGDEEYDIVKAGGRGAVDPDEEAVPGAREQANAMLRLDAIERAAVLQVAMWAAFDHDHLNLHFGNKPLLPFWPLNVMPNTRMYEAEPADMPWEDFGSRDEPEPKQVTLDDAVAARARAALAAPGAQ